MRMRGGDLRLPFCVARDPLTNLVSICNLVLALTINKAVVLISPVV
jgi:hypothetical protein